MDTRLLTTMAKADAEMQKHELLDQARLKGEEYYAGYVEGLMDGKILSMDTAIKVLSATLGLDLKED